jgi:hypothetical protein
VLDNNILKDVTLLEAPNLEYLMGNIKGWESLVNFDPECL